MGAIPSATTVYAQAYLTSRGRELLFNSPQNPRYKTMPNGQIIDLLKIERFSLGDPDVNYNVTSGLTSGDIPDVSGENETAVTGAKGRTLTNLISPGESNIPSDTIESVVYQSSNPIIRFSMSQALANLPTVVTQQLLTYMDGALVSDGIYHVTPTNYGKNKLVNNELVIILKQPRGTNPGFRLRIFFPTTGANYNKMTFQFEVGYTQGNLPPVVVTPTTTPPTTTTPRRPVPISGGSTTPTTSTPTNS
jgi:hypothetical protein